MIEFSTLTIIVSVIKRKTTILQLRKKHSQRNYYDILNKK